MWVRRFELLEVFRPEFQPISQGRSFVPIRRRPKHLGVLILNLAIAVFVNGVIKAGGHGICGLARLSKRSFAAVFAFMACGFATVYVLRHATGLLP